MNYQALKQALTEVKELNFITPSKGSVPSHFHITEAGVNLKSYFDCGGEFREEVTFGFQLWVADDIDHRLTPEKAISIVEMSNDLLKDIENVDVLVEYQGETKEIYNLEFDGTNFLLLNTETDCLAKDKCGIKREVKIQSKGCEGGYCC